MSQIKKIGAAIVSAVFTVLIIVWLFAGPGWETFYPLVHDLFVEIGNSIHLEPPPA